MKFSYLSGSLGVPTRYSIEPYKSKTKLIVLVLAVSLVVFGFSMSQLLASSRSVARASSEIGISSATNVSAQKVRDAVKAPEPISQFDDKKIAVALKNWVVNNRGSYSIVVSDQSGKELAQYASEEQFYMASLYKLYVAYIGYQKVDSGVYSFDELYLDGMTRGKCLDEMVRTSHNACGEKMMAELGSELKTSLASYGFSATSVAGFTTSAKDTNKMLAMIKNGTNLSESSKAKLLDSMLGQKYRKGMPAGFETAKVYDKVGFRGEQEYHDVGIIELSDGRTLMVSILSDKAGVAKIADLSRTLSASL